MVNVSDFWFNGCYVERTEWRAGGEGGSPGVDSCFGIKGRARTLGEPGRGRHEVDSRGGQQHITFIEGLPPRSSQPGG